MKKSTKILSVFLAVLTMFSVMAIGASAEDATTCEHTYGDTWTVILQPTCTETGTKERKCSKCGKAEYERVNNLGGHKFEETGTVVAPTCTEEGYTIFKCTNLDCTESKKDNIVPATGHTYAEDANGIIWIVTKEAKCTESGLKYSTCAVCSMQNEVEIPAKGHTWEVVEKKEADYVSGGFTKEKCKDCGEERISNETNPLPDKIKEIKFIDEKGEEANSAWYTVAYGKTHQIQLVIRTEAGKIATDDMIKSITFESSDEKIASVDNNGLITGAGTGMLNLDSESRASKITCTVVDVDGNVYTAKCSAQVDLGAGDWLTIIFAVLKILFVDVIGGIIKGFFVK